jgi:hypothetical protein
MARCPRLNCNGILDRENDGYNVYYTCISCSRQFDKDLIPLRRDPTALDSYKTRLYKISESKR